MNIQSRGKHILILAYYFPPFSGVASRRWACFADALAKAGSFVHVVTVNWDDYGTYSWMNAINHPNIFIYRTKSGYPHEFIKWSRSTHLKRMLSIGIRKTIPLFYSLDVAQKWGKYLIPKCEDIISKNNINRVIATGQPFMVNAFACQLKRRFPSIVLMQDFRDSWNEGPLKKMPLRLKEGYQKQIEAINAADVITVVSPSMKELLLKEFNFLDGEKVKILYNGFIPIKNSGFTKPSSSSRFTLTYAGGLGFGRSAAFKSVCEAISRLNCKSGEPLITLNYFGKDGQLAKDIAIKFGVNITLHGPKSPEIVIENQKKSNVLLILNSQIFPHAMSSKLFEHVSLGKKSLIVSPEGDLSRMASNFPSHTFHAEEHEVDRIGTFIHDQCAMFVKTGKLFFEEPPALLEKYSFNTLTGQLLQWLNK